MMKLRSVTVLALLATVVSAPGRANGDDTSSRSGNTLREFGYWGLKVVGLTADQRLVAFREGLAARTRTIGTVFGLVGDTALVGIDFRPATGNLYGLGDAGGIYTLDTETAEATFKVQLSVPLSGTSFSVDFNPTVDRLRIVSDTGQNLRANVVDGVTTVDLALNYAGVAAAGVTGAAYTNNDLDPNTATTLYDIDSTLDQVVIQAPPNNGTLNPTGKLRVDVGSAVGFDIYSYVREGRTVAVRAFAALTVGGRAGFFWINLFTGEASLRGWFRPSDQVVDIAVPLDQH